MYRLRRMRTGVPGRSDQARYRGWHGKVARSERRIRQELAEYHREARTAGGCQGMGRGSGQVRETLLARARYRRLNGGQMTPREPATAVPGCYQNLTSNLNQF